MKTCQGCGSVLAAPGRPGPPRKWCSDRCRKVSLYSGTCIDCGGRTQRTASGLGRRSVRCTDCAVRYRHENRYWTRCRIIAAVQRFADETGQSPSSARWVRGDKPGWAPDVSLVRKEFGTWSAVILAAGLTPLPVGRPRKAAA
jgi:Homing endonuclease associated repeat